MCSLCCSRWKLFAIWFFRRFGPFGLHYGRSTKHPRCHCLPQVVSRPWPHELCSWLGFWGRTEALSYQGQLARKVMVNRQRWKVEKKINFKGNHGTHYILMGPRMKGLRSRIRGTTHRKNANAWLNKKTNHGFILYLHLSLTLLVV